MATATLDSGVDIVDLAQALLKRVYTLEQRITSPAYVVPNGSTPTFSGVTVGTFINGTSSGTVLDRTSSSPTNLTLTPSTTFSEVQVSATWSAPVDGTAAEFELQVFLKNPQTLAYTLDSTVRTYGTSAVVTGLLPNRTYGFRVVGINRIGITSAAYPATGYQDATTSGDATIPAAPTGVTASAGVTSVTLAWNDNTEADVVKGAGLYRVQRATDSAFTANVDTRLVSATITSFTGLTSGTPYYFRVLAIDASGNEGPYANASPFPVTPGTAGGSLSDGLAPTSSPTPNVRSGIGFLQVDWTAITNADAVTYEVHMSTTTGFTPSGSTKLEEVDGTTTLVTTDLAGVALTYGTTYYFKIIAKDRDGSAAAGAQGSGQIRRVQDADVTTITGNKVKDGSVPSSSPTPTLQPGFGSLIARWAPVANNDPVIYEVYLSPTSGFTPAAGTLVGQVDGTTLSIRQDGSNTALVYGTTYYCKIIARDADGAAAASGQSAGASILQIGSTDLTSAVNTSISTAQTTATNAQTTADGKNKVFYQTTAPVGGLVTNDLWFKTDADNQPYKYNGSSWVAYQLGNSAILGNLDAAKITAGFLSANVIQGGSISASKLSVVIGGGNLVSDSAFESITPTAAWTSGTRSTAFKHSGNQSLSITRSGGATALVTGTGANALPLVAGDLVVLSAWVYMTTAMTTRINLNAPVTNGDLTPTNADTTKLNQWQRVIAKYTIPTTGNYVPRFYSDSGIDGTWYVDDVQVEVGDLATSYSPKVDEILPGTIVASNLVAGTLTSASGVFGTVDASILTAGTISAARIGADTINSSMIVTGGLDAGVIKFGTMSGDRIQANTITTSRLTLAARSDSLVQNGNFEEGTTGWAFCEGNGNGSFYVEASSDYWQGSGSNTAVISTGGGGTFAVSSEAFPVNPGERLTCSIKLANTGGGSTYWRLFWYNDNPGSTRSHNGNIAELRSPGAGAPGAPMQAMEGAATVPANIRWARMAVYNWSGSTYTLIDNATVTRSVVGTDITPGAITAEKIGAGEITSDKINVAGLDAGHIKFGTMDGDRISAASMDVGVLDVTTTLTSRTLIIGSNGQIKIGNPGVGGSYGALIDPTGIRLYRGASESVRLDATNGNGLFTGTINAEGGTFSGNITSSATITGGTLATGIVNQNRVVVTSNRIDFISTTNSPTPAYIAVVNYLPGSEAYGQQMVLYSGKNSAYPNNGAAIYISPGTNGSGGIDILTAPVTSQAGNIRVISGRNLDMDATTITISDYNEFHSPYLYGNFNLTLNVNSTQPRLVPALDAVNDNSRIRMWERRRLSQTMSAVTFADTSISWIGYWDTRPVTLCTHSSSGAVFANNVAFTYNNTNLSATVRTMDVNAAARTGTANTDMWMCI